MFVGTLLRVWFRRRRTAEISRRLGILMGGDSETERPTVLLVRRRGENGGRLQIQMP